MSGAYRLLCENEFGHYVGPPCDSRDEALEPIRNILMSNVAQVWGMGGPKVGPPEPLPLPKYSVLVDLDALADDSEAMWLAFRQDPTLRAIYEMGRRATR